MTDQESDNTKIAVINTNIAYIKKDIEDIKTVLKEGYATKDFFVEVAKQTEVRLTKLENANTIQKWLNPVVASILASLLTFLIINYLSNVNNIATNLR